MVKRNIVFDSVAHSYKDEDNNCYTSVTQLIEKYKEPFDINYWAEKKSKELKLPKEVVLQNWKDIKDYACDKGNKVHENLENDINNSIVQESNSVNKLSSVVNKLLSVLGIPLNTKGITNVDLDVFSHSNLAKTYPEIFEYLKKYILDGCTLYVEKRVYLYEYLIAGTIDCLLIKGKQFLIVDWKTNKDELKFEAGYYKKVNNIKTDNWIKTDTRMLSPINYLPECKGIIYTLQLSLYAYILEQWGLQCIGLTLFHIRNNNKPISYNIKYEKSSAELILIDNKNKLKNELKNNLLNNLETFDL